MQRDADRRPERESESSRSLWAQLSPVGRAVLTAAITAGGLVTFVAAVGGAIVWVRFYAAKLPADQVLAAMPRGELVASGGIMLAIFVVLGAIAVIGVYLFRTEILGQPSDGSSETEPLAASGGVVRGLIVLVTAESVVIVALTVGAATVSRVVAAELIVLFALLMVLVVRWRETLPPSSESVENVDNPGRELGSVMRRMVLKPGGVDRSGSSRLGWLLAVSMVLAVLAVAPLELFTDSIMGLDERLIEAGLLGVALLWAALVISWRWLATGFRTPDSSEVVAGPSTELQRRMAKFMIIALAGIGAACASAVLGEWWVAVTLAVAIALGIVSWRLAKTANYAFLPCGVAAFVSVPLLGAAAGVTRNFADPQLQPVALIRADDGLDQALQGIYVTETDDRVYLATVATDRCGGRVEPGSGRLVWVPRDEIVAMSLGPAQSVEDAGARAQEMYDALAPRAANPYATRVSERREDGAPVALEVTQPAAEAPAEAVERRRLEDLGSTIRRDFDVEPDLDPPRARVGERVTIDGTFPKTQGERRVMVGDVPADVVSWTASKIAFVVPRGATSGTVEIDCEPLGRQPFFRVLSAPDARITVEAPLGARQLVLRGDSSLDFGGGEIRQHHWRLYGGVTETGVELSRSVLSRHGLRRFSLTVVDDDRDRDRADVYVWRIGAERVLARGGMATGRGLRRLKFLLHAGGHDVVLHGYSNRRRDNDASTLAAAVKSIATADLPKQATARVSLRAFDGACVGGGDIRHVDVFVVEDADDVAPPAGCPPSVLD